MKQQLAKKKQVIGKAKSSHPIESSWSIGIPNRPLMQVHQTIANHELLRRSRYDDVHHNDDNKLRHLTATWQTGAPPVEKTIPKSSLDSQMRNHIEASLNNGYQVPQPLRSTAEERLGTDLSDVHVHIGKHTDELTRDLDAAGFTLGKDVFLSSKSIHKPEVLTHELRHAVENDPYILSFWTEPPPLETYVPHVRSTLRGTPSFGSLQEALSTLITRTARRSDTERDSNRREQHDFFQSYGLEEFVNDFSDCLERMARAARFQEEHPSDETEQQYADRYFSEIRIAIANVYPPYEGAVLQRLRRILIERNEPDWISYWQEWYGRRPYNVRHFPLYILGRWSDFLDHSRGIGEAAQNLEWRVSRENRYWSSSVRDLRHPVEAMRNRAHSDGLLYFEGIRGRYEGSWERLLGTICNMQDVLTTTPATQTVINQIQLDLDVLCLNWERLVNVLGPGRRGVLEEAILPLWNACWRSGIEGHPRPATNTVLLSRIGYQQGRAGTHLPPRREAPSWRPYEER